MSRSLVRIRSLRVRLALTYAGIALLAAAILGGVLLGVLSDYYGRAESAYLRAAAGRIGHGPALASTETSAVAGWVRFAALDSQTRVEVLSASGAVLADSGSPDQIDPRAQSAPGDAPRPPHDVARMPSPLGSGLFAPPGEASPRSSRTLRIDAAGLGLPTGSVLVLSEGPASGTDALRSVAEAWVIAAVLAVGLAGAAGTFLAARIAHPIDLLTEASDRMAEGDLGSRADVHRDDEVGRLADSFNAMATRTQETMTGLRRFVSDAAHEIGTPLTALQADLDLADAQAASADERRLIARALTQAARLEGLSANLLRLSRIETGDQGGQRERLDLNEVARQAADAVASRAEQAGLTLQLEVAAGALPVDADRGQLQVVLENLLDNAVKFTPDGGTVTLGTSAEAGSAALWVQDTGVGIPEAEREQVFERFHRARNAASYQGSGLGLAIVRASIVRFGGTVELASPAAGTRIDVRLPLAG